MSQLDIFELLTESKIQSDEEVELKPMSQWLKPKMYKKYNLCYWRSDGKYIHVYYPVNMEVEDIKDGFEVYHTTINGTVYSSVLTNTLNNYHLRLMDEYSKKYQEAIIFGIRHTDDEEIEEDE